MKAAMLQIDDKIISTELFEVKFACHLQKCKGMCCVYGDAGAPLTDDETELLEEEYSAIKPFLREGGISAIDEQGKWVFDVEGDKVTPLMGKDDCAYSIIDNGIARCGIENAYQSDRATFQKPISCHLYPLRVSKVGENYALNYHQWSVCSPALKLGNEYNMPVFRFLKDSIIRAFGESFFNKMEVAYKDWKNRYPD